MDKFESDIRLALKGDGPIPRDLVLSWIEGASNLSTLAKLYRLTDVGYNRIEPELGADVTCALIQRYLLQCIQENVESDEDADEDDYIESRFEAAQSLHAWFLHLLKMGKQDQILKHAAYAVTELFITGDEGIRNTIETGFLEHVLETAGLRPYFEHWSRDERLREAWKNALEWGEAHPDYMDKMYESLQRHGQ